jgi:phospholipid N-methyltransferase
MKNEYLSFLRELPSSFQEIGAMLPSSRFLGRDMVRAVREANGPINILEVGPGTGPFTRQILRYMGAEDRLTVCEINERFLSLLRERLSRNQDYLNHRDRVRFILGAVQDLPRMVPGERYDVIVSSLPFSNFSPALVEEIAGVFEVLIAPGGSITVLEYLGLRKLSLAFSTPERRRRLAGVERVVQAWRHRVRESGRVKTRVSFLNVPPALSIQFRYEAESRDSRGR